MLCLEGSQLSLELGLEVESWRALQGLKHHSSEAHGQQVGHNQEQVSGPWFQTPHSMAL